MIELFIHDSSLLDYKTRNNKRPIDVAAEYGNLIVIQRLLQIKPLEIQSEEGVAALVQAAARHHQNEVLLFLKKQYQQVLNRHLNTLHFACSQLHGDKMLLHLINPKNIMYQDKQSGFSPLMVAVQHRQLKCIKELLGHNDFTSEAFELTSSISLSTVLHICAKVNQNDITTAIFDCPYMSISLVVTADVQGDTPLHICAQVGNVYMTQRLLDYMSQNISPVVPISHQPTRRTMTNLDSNGRAPSKWSDQKTLNTSSQSTSLNDHVYKMLTKKNKSKLTPLHVAIHYGKVDVIEKMFKFVHPSIINEHDDQWRTSLHMAAEKG
jgi:ankyrin repeat protein